jgi:DNA-binding MarR family transcriptional regulator
MEKSLQNAFISRADPKFQILTYGGRHAIEVLGWVQQKILSKHELNTIQVAFLRRADQHRGVSFAQMRDVTGLQIHAIRRAAYGLEDRDLGLVRHEKSDRRRRKFHINTEGRALLKAIDTQIGIALLEAIGVDWFDSLRYHNFAVSLWHLCRYLPNSGVAKRGISVPSGIRRDINIGSKQEDVDRFIEDLAANLKLSPVSSTDWDID